jgi:hypothetical protein
MTRLSMSDAQCDALFASRLRRSDAPTAEAIAEAIRWAVQQFGAQGAPPTWRKNSEITPKRPPNGCAGSAGSPPSPALIGSNVPANTKERP